MVLKIHDAFGAVLVEDDSAKFGASRDFNMHGFYGPPPHLNYKNKIRPRDLHRILFRLN